MIEKIESFLKRHAALEKEMADPDFANDQNRMKVIGQEYTDLNNKLPKLKEYLEFMERRQESSELLRSEKDPELVEMAKMELEEIDAALPSLEEEVKKLLVPTNPADFKNALIEIRAGTGGVEAGLFANELMRMYHSFCEQKGFSVEVMSTNYSEPDALKEGMLMVSGEKAYGLLKYESGVHRVQRVPKTESQGRVHTSAASVVVLPEAEEVEIEIDKNDLRIDYYRSSGPGGQSVNTTDSAVRIIHLPTNITVTCQDEKSQHKNKAQAMKILQSRLYDHELQKKQKEDSESRLSMIGTGDRSQKIRTYNYPQGRVTDHRINFSVFKLESVLGGDLDDFIDALSQEAMQESLRKAGEPSDDA
ncbi:peptide chain release factor 1 [Chitinivibrio alkaliphilus]|uniref:Peptide chain release factor 1 n=1 Tax=Chitinivibrio alkaliphilus ACht1 TaxID=1313304 RepID=U7D969_9BACT|nr:peptide chain release factor 1 [Chitinivibrio alkaliphilus]ERP30945.1 peptide chain release factor 1 [Chitinivibrio alkaliphilus ACht1]